LEIEALERRFGAVKAVSGFDLTLSAGERVALVGPNGSGKSTILRCVAGSLSPSSGRVSIAGHAAGSIEARRLVGASLARERAFSMTLSGRENLLFFARVRHRSKRVASAYVGELEQELELTEILEQRLDRCSTGMLQQLAFARALLARPSLLVLDEPTRSLDADARERLWGALGRRPLTAALVATHADSDTARCGRRVDLGH
jgi:ABC-type multidrug transport system ATPase subunit